MDFMKLSDIASLLQTSEGIAQQIMGDTPFLYLGKGKGKGRRYNRTDVLAVIQSRMIDPRTKPAQKNDGDEFWALPRKERLRLLRGK
jgi:hypothetical protein